MSYFWLYAQTHGSPCNNCSKKTIYGRLGTGLDKPLLFPNLATLAVACICHCSFCLFVIAADGICLPSHCSDLRMSKFNYSMGIASLEWLGRRALTPPRSRYSARSCEFEGHIAYTISKVHRTVFFCCSCEDLPLLDLFLC